MNLIGLDPGGVARWWVDPWVGELVSSGGTVPVNGRKLLR